MYFQIEVLALVLIANLLGTTPLMADASKLPVKKSNTISQS